MEPVCFYTFQSHPAIRDAIERRHPPDDRQRRLCDYVKVPTHVWSFYRYKHAAIHHHFDPANGLGFWCTTDFWNSSEQQYRKNAKMSEACVRSYFNRLFPDLTLDEKFFCVHARSIEHLQRRATCLLFNPVRLQDACATTLSQSHPADALKRVLPPHLFRKVSKGVPSPTPYRSDGPSLCVSFCKTFSECDRIFPKGFVMAFQNSCLVRCTEDPNSLRLVYSFYVTRHKQTNGTQRENVCSHCMKKELAANKTKILERRYFYNYTDEFGGLFRHQLVEPILPPALNSYYLV